jgi:hypothetical protein
MHRLLPQQPTGSFAEIRASPNFKLSHGPQLISLVSHCLRRRERAHYTAEAQKRPDRHRTLAAAVAARGPRP